MLFGQARERIKMFTSRRIGVLLLLLLFLLLLVSLTGSGCRRAVKETGKVPAEKREVKLERLYKQALKDIERKKFTEAKFKLQHILAMEPNYKKAREKLKETVKAIAEEQAKKEEKAAAQPGVSGTTTQPGTTPQPSPGEQSPSEPPTTPSEAAESPKDIPLGATPYDLLPPSDYTPALNGYVAGRKVWVIRPIEAAGRYNPTDINISGYIEFVMITIAQFENKTEADKRLALEKERYPNQNKDLTVNGHSAYFGLYDESHPEIFPYLSQLVWTRNNWFFSIMNVPRKLDQDYSLHEKVAKDIARQMGY